MQSRATTDHEASLVAMLPDTERKACTEGGWGLEILLFCKFLSLVYPYAQGRDV